MVQKLVFISVIFPGQQAERPSLLLAESIRRFGGGLAGSPVHYYLPDYGKTLTAPTVERLQRLDVHLVPFPINRQRLEFFFMGQLAALALAEERTDGQADLLVWMDSNTLLLQEPSDLLLPPGASLGCRPVHHLLLGSRYDLPPDPFWTQIYASCRVPPERIFPMRPVVEDIQMRPYINAGFLAVRPEKRLLRRWYHAFLALYQEPVFQAFQRQDERYVIFMHQSVLAGVMLAHLKREEIHELPETYNYPVHLYENDDTPRRPARLDDLVTFRHEGFDTGFDWRHNMPASDALRAWLEEKLAEIP